MSNPLPLSMTPLDQILFFFRCSCCFVFPLPACPRLSSAPQAQWQTVAISCPSDSRPGDTWQVTDHCSCLALLLQPMLTLS